MKRLLVTLCAAAAMTAALALPTTIGASSGQAFAAGGFQGVLAFGHQNIAFSARLTSQGVVGHVTETITPDTFGELATLQGDPVCFAASGNRAAVGFVVVRSTGILTAGSPVGSMVTLAVEDNGSNASDLYAFTSATCTDALSGPLFPIAHGNIIVRE